MFTSFLNKYSSFCCTQKIVESEFKYYREENRPSINRLKFQFCLGLLINKTGTKSRQNLNSIVMFLRRLKDEWVRKSVSQQK